MSVESRAMLHRALGDEIRLRVVDALVLGDRSSSELARELQLPSNLLAHHLGVLVDTGVIAGHVSEGDRRRRYLSLRPGVLAELGPEPGMDAGPVLFVCTHNSARSQFAAAAFRARSGLPAQSAGTRPAPRIHPKAISAAAELGIDLSQAVPRPYQAIRAQPDLVVSVCDRAREAPPPFGGRSIHWSIPDPVAVDRLDAFRSAFREISDRVDRLVGAMERGSQP